MWFMLHHLDLVRVRVFYRNVWDLCCIKVIIAPFVDSGHMGCIIIRILIPFISLDNLVYFQSSSFMKYTKEYNAWYCLYLRTLDEWMDLQYCPSLWHKTSRAPWTIGYPWTRPCNPQKNLSLRIVFCLIRGTIQSEIQETGRVGNEVVALDEDFFFFFFLTIWGEILIVV